MADAPGNIWLQHGDPYEPYAENTWSEHKTDEAPAETRYVRADLVPQWRAIDDPEHPAPKDGRLVLLRTESGDEWAGTFTAYWSSSRNLFFYAQDRSVTRATHWQPLPAPPEAD